MNGVPVVSLPHKIVHDKHVEKGSMNKSNDNANLYDTTQSIEYQYPQDRPFRYIEVTIHNEQYEINSG